MYEYDFDPSLLNYGHYKKLNLQLEKDLGDFLRSKTNAPQLYSNDLRHQWASALYTQNKGNLYAKILGGLNEFPDYFMSDTREDSDIDLINNEIGRNYGEQYPNMPPGELLGKLLTDWGQNKEIRNQKMFERGYKKYGNRK